MRASMTALGLAVLVAFAVPRAAAAQIQFGVGGGPTFPVGDAADGFDTGWNAQLNLGLSFPLMPVGIRLDGTYQRLPSSTTDDVNFNMMSATANAIFSPLPLVVLKPYFIGGVGLYRGELDVDGAESSTDLGINAGLGVQFGLGPLQAFAEARLHNIFGEDDSTRVVPVTIGIQL